MTFVSLDPGGTTGWCTWTDTYDQQDKFDMGQITGDWHNNDLFEFLIELSPDEVICEDFTYQQRKMKGSDVKIPQLVLVSRDYIGVARLYCQRWHRPLHMQMPPVKEFWTGPKDTYAKLKQAGLYKANAPHANDATAHMLQYLIHQKGRRDLLELIRPSTSP